MWLNFRGLTVVPVAGAQRTQPPQPCCAEEKPEQEQVLVFQLVQVKNGWRIDDIIYTKDNTSLKAVISAIVKGAADLKK